MHALAERIKTQALELGFDAAGIAPAAPGEHLPQYLDWLAAGYHGEQSYLARPDRLARRRDLRVIQPEVESLLVVGLHYWPGPPPAEAEWPSHGRISAYAQGPDYHHVMLPKLEALGSFVQEQTGRSGRSRAYVDTGPLLERDHALAAGLGFIGKNCHLIQPQRGSWLFLGVLMLPLPLEPDTPGRTPSCGTCARCQDACPSNAFIRPHTLDCRRCISYLTTALKGPIPRELRPLVGNRVFGCDDCQQVCPWNRFAQPTGRQQLAPPLLDLIRLAESLFQQQFGDTPIGHIGRERLLRNVAVALGNWAAPEAAPPLKQALTDPGPLVRGHAAWALGQIGTGRARTALAQALSGEPDPSIREEIQLALDGAA